MYQISILGSGSVARFFYLAPNPLPEVQMKQSFSRKGVQLHPNQPKSQIITTIEALTDADIFIIAVSDNAIREVVEKIPLKKVPTVHTSGAAPMEILNTQASFGVWYPLQTFSKDRKVESAHIPFCLEASSKKLLELLKDLSSLLTTKIYLLSSAQRLYLHLAAVFSNNFVNHLMTITQDICQDHNIPYELLLPLIKKTMDNALANQSESSQTGPAIRNDQKTIKDHLNLLPSRQQEIYRLLTKAIQEYYGKKL